MGMPMLLELVLLLLMITHNGATDVANAAATAAAANAAAATAATTAITNAAAIAHYVLPRLRQGCTRGCHSTWQRETEQTRNPNTPHTQQEKDNWQITQRHTQQGAATKQLRNNMDTPTTLRRINKETTQKQQRRNTGATKKQHRDNNAATHTRHRETSRTQQRNNDKAAPKPKHVQCGNCKAQPQTKSDAHKLIRRLPAVPWCERNRRTQL